MFRKLAGLAVVACLFVAGTTSAQITGSAHDFSQNGAFNSGGEICIACHTTHNTDLTVAAEAPLWNHTLTTNGDFTPYSGFSMVSNPSATVNAGSLLCLSCHDGTVALDSYGDNTPTAGTLTGNANVTKNLTDDHPISMDYPAAAVGAGGLHPVSATTELGGTITADYLNGGTSVECFSCHNVHNDVGTVGALLKVDNAGSVLCMDCHDK